MSYGAPVCCELWPDPRAHEPAATTMMMMMMMMEDVWRKNRLLQNYRPKEMLRATIGEHVDDDDGNAAAGATQFLLSSCRICEDLPSLAKEATTTMMAAAEGEGTATKSCKQTVHDTPTEQLLSAEVVRWLLPPSMQLCSSRMYATVGSHFSRECAGRVGISQIILAVRM